jgi:4'-phosphopantetheinyl transferase
MTTAAASVDVSYRLTGGLDERALARDAALLSADERARGDRFVFAEDRRDFVAAHALVRRALSHCRPFDASAWSFVASRSGKPEVAASQRGHPPIAFNLSHTRGLVACAVSTHSSVGIDVESTARDVVPLVHRYFHPSEAAHIDGYPASTRPLRAIELWTLKEAFLKAVGAGLSIPLRDCVFALDDGSALRFSQPAAAASSTPWQFALYALAAGRYRLAVAWQGPPDALPVVSSLGGDGDTDPLTLVATSIAP